MTMKRKMKNRITQQQDDNHFHTAADADPYEQPTQT